jgi:hypothetical protein
MGRDKSQRRKNGLSKFVATPWDVLNSPAYIKMKPSAAKALPYFLGEPKLPFSDPEYLRIKFPFSYPKGKKLGFAKATWAIVLRELVENGFIDPVSKGGLRGNGKTSSQFRLSDRWKKYGQHDFESIDLKTWGT